MVLIGEERRVGSIIFYLESLPIETGPIMALSKSNTALVHRTKVALRGSLTPRSERGKVRVRPEGPSITRNALDNIALTA